MAFTTDNESILSRTNNGIILFSLWLLLFSSSSQIMIISPILPEIGNALDINESLQGTLITAYALCVGLFAIIIGPLSDRVGRRKILIIGTGALSIALGLHNFAFDYNSLLSLRSLAGMSAGILSGGTVAYVGDFFPYNQRGWANGWIMSGLAAGQILGIPCGIYLAGLFGFKAPFLAFSIICLIAFIIMFFYLPQPNIKLSHKKISIDTAIRKYRIMLMKSEIAVSALVYFLMFLSLSIFFVFLPTWLKHHINVTDESISLMFMVGGIANVITGPNAGKLSDKIGRRNIIIIANLGLALTILSTTFVINSSWMSYPFFVFIMIFIAARISPFQALITELVSPKKRGSLLSLLVAIGQVGYGMGGAIAGPSYAHGGFMSNTLIASFFVAITAFLIFRFLPEPKID